MRDGVREASAALRVAPGAAIQRLAARNLIVGRADFLLLPLPSPWRITPAVVTPEVRTTRRIESQNWVVSGETRHVVFDRERNLPLELIVRICHGTPRLPRRAAQMLETGAAVSGGHEAHYQIVRRRRGVLVRGEEHALLIAFVCPVTARGIWVQVAGPCAVEELREFVRAMAGLECH